MTRQNLEGAGSQMPGTVSLSRLLRGGAVVALVLSAGGVLAGCALVGDGAQSEQSSAAGASGEQAMSTPTEKIMSGEYEVGPDGKLLNPNRNKKLTPPEFPELAKEHTKEGAEAFARYYIELLPYMWMSGDTEILEKNAHSDCTFCEVLISDYKNLKKDGGWHGSLSYKINSIGPTFEIPDHPGIWNVDIDATRSAFTGFDGEKILHVEPYEDRAHIQLQYEHGQWRLWAVGKR